MPTYEWACPSGHTFEHFCSISAKPDRLPCPHLLDAEQPCGLPAKQVFLSAPLFWIPGVNKETVLDYPGSKKFKAGYVHSHVDAEVKKVSVGAGGVLNPRTSGYHPSADWVQPEWKTKAE